MFIGMYYYYCQLTPNHMQSFRVITYLFNNIYLFSYQGSILVFVWTLRYSVSVLIFIGKWLTYLDNILFLDKILKYGNYLQETPFYKKKCLVKIGHQDIGILKGYHQNRYNGNYQRVYIYINYLNNWFKFKITLAARIL